MSDTEATIPIEQNIDFLPATYHAARGKTKRRVWRRFVLVVFLGLIVAGAVRQRDSHTERLARVVEIERRADDANRHVGDEVGLQQQIDQLTAETHLWLQLRVRPSASRVLTSLAKARPIGVSLTRLSCAPDASGIGIPGREGELTETADPVRTDLDLLLQHRADFAIHVDGLAGSDESVSEFSRRLETAGFFDRVRLIVTESAIVRGHPMRRFSLELHVRPSRSFPQDDSLAGVVRIGGESR